MGDRASALQEALVHLKDDAQNLSSQLLTSLSDLSGDELSLFNAAWDGLDARRRRAVLSCLEEMAENNVEFDFAAIFKRALGDADALVRRQAIAGLWEDEEPSLIRPLLKIMAER
jgi:hypothetical protein